MVLLAPTLTKRPVQAAGSERSSIGTLETSTSSGQVKTAIVAAGFSLGVARLQLRVGLLDETHKTLEQIQKDLQALARRIRGA